MYLLRRTSKTPATPFQITVDQPDPSSPDAGMGGGGTFYFAPAGQEGDRFQATRHTAMAIMSDPELSKHFACTPPLPEAKAAVAEKVEAAAEQQDAPAAETAHSKPNGKAKADK